MSVFSTNLKSLMTKNETKTEKLAQYLGMTKQAISNYTLGKTTPNFEILIKIAEFFNVSTDYLLTGITIENKATNENMQLNLTNSTIENLRKLSRNNEKLLFYVNEILGDQEFYDTLQKTLEGIERTNKILSFEVQKNKSILSFSREVKSYCNYLSKMLMEMYFNNFFEAIILNDMAENKQKDI